MLATLKDRIRAAAASSTTLAVQGRDSKRAFLPPRTGEVLPMAEHRGIIDYQPNELILRARAGTPLAEIDAALSAHHQMIAAEPPDLEGGSTLGGAIACGWSGPRRPWAGALRDQLLGVHLINGRGELLRFGGNVIKNVAGFDVSRLTAGSFGSLGVITEACIKVSPRPEADIVLTMACGQAEAIRRANQASAVAIPLSGAAWDDGVLRLRLAGNAAAVAAGRAHLGGDEDPDGIAWFQQLRHFRHPLFGVPAPGMQLWRLSLPPAAPPLLVGYPQLVDWGGGQRWLLAHLEAAPIIQAAASAAGGYASCRRSCGTWPVPTTLPAATARLQRQLKLAFDPAGVFNSAPPLA